MSTATPNTHTRRLIREGKRLRWELLPVSVAVPYVTAIEAHAATGAGTSTAVAYGVVAAVGTGVAAMGADKKNADAVIAGGTVGVAAAWASWQSAMGPSVAGVVTAALGVGMCGIPYWRYLAARRDDMQREHVKIEIEKMKFAKWLESKEGQVIQGEIVQGFEPGPPDPWPGRRLGEIDTTAPIGIGNGVSIPLEGGHVKVGGMTGAGKSCLMHVIVCDLLSRENMAILGIDCKPGAPELGRYRHAGVRVVTEAADAEKALEFISHTLNRRGEINDALTREAMTTGGKLPPATWVPTAEEPWWTVIIDEITELADTKAMEIVDRLSRLSRSYGVTLFVMTQSVEAAVFSVGRRSGGGARAQYGTSVCLRVDTEAEAFKMLGTGCVREGWDPTKLPLQGHMLVKGPGNHVPVPRRSYYVDDVRTVEHIRTIAAARGITVDAVEVTRDAEPALPSGAGVREVPGNVEPAPEPVVRGTLGDRIVAHLRAHGESRAKEVAETTGAKVEVVRATFKTLRDNGRIEGDGAGKFWAKPTKNNVLEFRRP